MITGGNGAASALAASISIQSITRPQSRPIDELPRSARVRPSRVGAVLVLENMWEPCSGSWRLQAGFQAVPGPGQDAHLALQEFLQR